MLWLRRGFAGRGLARLPRPLNCFYKLCLQYKSLYLCMKKHELVSIKCALLLAHSEELSYVSSPVLIRVCTPLVEKRH